ncbi:sensor histidine kinase [Leuconostoc falkenbergense]|jgi:signal transduction histidine kinase|uniref:histidine kinase n=4 Tax=Lactobacillaceae TaxID=33958 RepID=A0A9X3E9S3_9LACO|nr:sensor histidine kinase [Leuconostoc falkenbergense]NLT84930.1 HAMP domain-containing histidine kinase [Leuconostoc sp.]RDG18445.1 sensor histidine kinase [Leuconostoc pseudomesenteroides]MCT4390172.1 sensor histidine kinase [Leuconostoc falkenbergense]MCT4411431.1 sensor histidine kinase [Leuconostoc falkenbergense]MCX7578997.1 sensor histidine kinase [Leuconostoc falkenbergense]
MIKKCLQSIWLFLMDYWYFYLIFVFIFGALFWSVVMRSLDIDAVIDALYVGLYFLFGMTLLLFWRWFQTRKILKNVLSDERLSVDNLSLPATSSVAHLYQNLLKQQTLEHKKVLANQANAMQDIQDYYAMWAHQIKVPLSVLDLMNQTNTIEKYETSNQLLIVNQYLNMMLQFIRLKNLHQDLTFKPIYVQAIVRDVIKSYKLFFIRQNLSVLITGEDFTVVSDPKWIQFVLEQIIFNAIKYTSQGCIQVIFENHHQVVIKDTGIGIAASDLPRLFDKGYTGLNGRLENNSSGLGLFMVKQILSELGHDIKIASVVGSGTTVTIDFKQTKTQAYETVSFSDEV